MSPADAARRRLVVVITGASSGIGRATARAFARRGAALVLAARSGSELDAVARECGRLGAAGALAVPTDVADHAQVETLGRRALERFGRIDVWVNDAGLLLIGRIDEAPVEDFERVVRVNLLGCAYGSRVAIRHFRQRGGRGTLVNVSSLAGGIGQTLFSAYVASKWGVRGLSEALRMELADRPGVHVCTVMPSIIDTPIVRHAANRTGRRIDVRVPVHPPERVAGVIVGLVDRPRAEVTVGDEGRLALLARSLLPKGLLARASAPMQEALMLSDEPEASGAGILYEPAAAHGATSVRGGLGASSSGDKVDASLRLAAATAVALLAGAGLALALRRARGRA